MLIHEKHLLLVKQFVPTVKDSVWMPPGGGVHMGESAEEALKREFREETQLEIEQMQLRYLHEFIQPPYHALELYYLITGFSGAPKLGLDPEHNSDRQLLEDILYVPVEKLETLALKPDFLIGEINAGKLYEPRINHFRSFG